MNVPGNYEDKYNTKNPISAYLMKGFLDSFDEMLDQVGQAKDVAEVGAGEGYLSMRLQKLFTESMLYVSDLEEEVVDESRELLGDKNVVFGVGDVESLHYENESMDLVVACEVLEHVQDPEIALTELHRVTREWMLVSVPQEPLWRVLNVLRGKYWPDWGNTPGHINHWSPGAFVGLVESKGFEIVEVRKPLPWTMVLGRKIEIQEASS